MGRLSAFLAALTLWALACEAAVPGRKPKVPAGRDPGGVAVGLIGAGVDYTLPQIAQRLARDGEGELVGWDVAADDRRPLDTEPPGADQPRGTVPASIILREAGATRLVVVRSKPGDGIAHGKAAVVAARSPARIALVAFASPERGEWEPFRQVAAHFSHMLFLVPAGDAGLDLDAHASYPAALDLPNVLVVTATDGRGNLLAGANRGTRTVDVAVPAEAVEAYGAEGKPVQLSGSMAAAARATALAARLLAVEPGLSGESLKNRLLSFAKPLSSPPGSAAAARAGWIADAQRIFRLE